MVEEQTGRVENQISIHLAESDREIRVDGRRVMNARSPDDLRLGYRALYGDVHVSAALFRHGRQHAFQQAQVYASG